MALQLHGGAGYMNEYPIARLWRDARVARIYGGTKRDHEGADHPRDLAAGWGGTRTQRWSSRFLLFELQWLADDLPGGDLLRRKRESFRIAALSTPICLSASSREMVATPALDDRDRRTSHPARRMFRRYIR